MSPTLDFGANRHTLPTKVPTQNTYSTMNTAGINKKRNSLYSTGVQIHGTMGTNLKEGWKPAKSIV